MATGTKFQQFVEDAAHGVHDLENDQLTVALTASAPSASADAVLSDLTEISYTNLSSRDLTTSSSGQTSGTYKLVVADLTLTASGAVPTFRYVVVYNDDAANDNLLGFYDHGEDLTLANGETFDIDADAVNGLLQLA